MSFIEKQAIKNFKAGDIIFNENDPGSSMFIIQSGKVEVSTVINQKRVVLAALKKGAIFGEMSLVDDRPRSATVKAVTDVSCLEIGRMLFNKRLETIPGWMQSFYQILVERLREANKKQSTLSSGEVAKRIVFLLSIFLSYEKPDSLDRIAVPWQESAETIAFLLNVPLEDVMKVMNKLTLTPLAKSEINYEKGRLFVTDDFQQFQKFSEFCKERYYEKLGRDVSAEFEKKSPEEVQILKFIGKLMGEQATASDLHVEFFADRCKKDIGKSLDDFRFELKDLERKGVLMRRMDDEGHDYYIVNRELLNMKLGVGKTLELFEKIEAKLG